MTVTTRRRRDVRILTITLILGLSRVAAAEERGAPRVSVDLTGCDPSFADEVHRIAGVELRAEVVGTAESMSSATQAVVTCRDAIVDLVVSDSVTSKRLERTVSLGETPPRARARLIALAVAELVSASWEEVESNPQPKVPAVAVTTPEIRESVRRAVSRVPRVAIDVMGQTRAFLGTGTLLFGGAVRASARLGASLTLRFDAGTEIGSVSRLPAGNAAIRTFGSSLGLGWALELGHVEALAWGGAGGGYVRLDGEAKGGFMNSALEGPWFGPEAGVDFIFFPRGLVHLTVMVLGGTALVGVKGNVEGASSVSVSGPWATAGVGVGIAR